MVAINELLQRVQSLYSKGVQSKDTRLRDRHIYSALLSARSILINQRYTKKQYLSEWIIQPLPCVELIKATIHECPCAPEGCTILRSKYKLPSPISGFDKDLIISVTTLDGNERIDPDTFENVKYSSGNKFTSEKANYYMKNGFMYITVYKLLKAVTILGIFDDPLEVQSFPSACKDGCDDCCKDVKERQFPIPSNLIRPLVQMANEELVLLFKQMGEDRRNNASDDAQATGSMVHQPNSDDTEN